MAKLYQRRSRQLRTLADGARLLEHPHVDRVPGDHTALKVRYIRHERRAGGTKAEHSIFDHWRAGSNRVLESLMMRNLLGVASRELVGFKCVDL